MVFDSVDVIRKKRVRIVRRILLCLLGISLVILTLGYFFVYDTVYESYTIEAGMSVDAADFGKYYMENTVFTEDVSWIDTASVGTYSVIVRNTIFDHFCELNIIDTTAPVASGVDMDWYMEYEITPEKLILEVFDATELTYEFLEDINMNYYDNQEVYIQITDMGNNSTTVTSNIKLIPLYETIYIEVGEEVPDYTVFLLDNTMDIVCISNLDEIENNILQSIEIEFELEGISMYSTLTIRDTIEPVADSVDVTGYFTTEFDALDFVANVEDSTEVFASFASEIDLTSTEKQSVIIELTDQGGNVTQIESTVTLEADVEAPVISCLGGEIRNVVGETITYRSSVTVADNCDEEIEIEFDNSEVDIYTAGEYLLYCVATDAAGNETAETYTVVIYEQDSVEAEVDAMAEAVLSEILDDTMTEYEIVEAIYWYCKYNISYTGYSDKSDYILGAYEGLKNHAGDCFTYASTAKVLLTKAGITNMDISKIPAATEHYWNLVDIGDGWVHFDSCARSDGTIIFLWTTEEVLEYSNSHNLTHNFDPEEYPELYE